MKRKNFTLSAISILLLSLILTVAYGYWRFEQAGSQGKKTSRQGPLQPIQLPPEADLNTMRELEAKLPDLAQAPAPDNAPVNLELFGYRATVASTPLAQPFVEKRVEDVFNYRVTFALTAAKSGFCLIDGMLHNQGDVLPDGGVIQKIEADKVLIQKNGQSSWIAVSTAETAQTPRILEPKDDR